MSKNDRHKKSQSALAAAKALRSRNFIGHDFDRIVEELVRTAQKSASSEKTTAAEKDALSAGIERFALARGEFLQALENAEQSTRSAIIDSVAAMLFGTMAFALYRPVTKRALQKIAEQAGHDIRQAKAKKNQPRENALLEFLRALNQKTPLRDSVKFAQSVRAEADFVANFGPDGWPSPRTIRRKIQDILTERR